MDLRKEFEKEKGHDCYAYLQKYAGANKEQDGFNDEYVEWLESKVNNVVLDDVIKCPMCGEYGEKGLDNRYYCNNCEIDY